MGTLRYFRVLLEAKPVYQQNVPAIDLNILFLLRDSDCEHNKPKTLKTNAC